MSRGPHRVAIVRSLEAAAPGLSVWTTTALTAACDPAAGAWVVTEAQQRGPAGAIQLLADRAGS